MCGREGTHFRRFVCVPVGESGHVRARVPLPRETPLFKPHQEVSVPSPLARWPRPVPTAVCGRPLPGLGASPGFPHSPRECRRQGREDPGRCAAVTDSNPARGTLRRVNDRARPAAARAAPGAARPITLSPSNAHSRGAIGPALTPPAPDWLRLQREPRPRPVSAQPGRGPVNSYA